MPFLRSRSARRRTRGSIAALASLAVVASALLSGGAASAAVPGGPATVATTVSFISGEDLTTPLTELRANEAAPATERRYALQIGYSCGATAPCENTTVTIAPQPLDPVYGTQRFATYDSSTLPAGAGISGSAAAGYTVTLGTLASGASGSFTVLYNFQTRLINTPSAQSYFLDGTTITNTVTIDAANAGATATASDSVTWRIDTRAPLVAFGPTSLARVGTDYVYEVRMATDCMWYYATANYGEPAKLCASEYSNLLELPAEAVFVSASPDGTYDSATHTVSWSESGQGAAEGWGSINGRGADRMVTVRFPDEAFADACVIDVSATLSTTVTYLDGQTKDATTSTTHQATNCEPFAAATPVTKTSNISRAPNLVWDGVGASWTITVGNRANVPGVAVIRDDTLNVPNIRAHSVTATGGTIQYVLDNGTSGTATGTYTAPAGRKLASIVVTSPELPGPNLDPGSLTRTTNYSVNIRYTTDEGAPAEGWERSNTASAVMTYPDTGLADIDEGTDTATIVVAPNPALFAVGLSRTIPSGGNPTAGQPVNYVVNARTQDVEVGAQVEPQYVFVAPYQWNIVPGSWSLAAGAPAGAVFDAKTVTINGQARQALYVHWPAGTVWGVNATWPNLSVQATPSASAPGGSLGVATAFAGEASNSFPGLTANWSPSRYTDAADLDGDGVTNEYFATANAAAVTVGAAAGLSTVKEICRVNPDAPDGCDWIADTSADVPVSPVATDVTYRVTLRNNGNTALSGVVAYDVLPHPGDTGVSSGSASVPRGSDFTEAVGTVSGVSANLALTYSASTNPCRAEVYAGGPAGCVNDWGPTAQGAASIRAAVTGTLAAGASATFVYTASVLGEPSSGDRACNSIATAAGGVPVSEPSPVCAAIVATDLRVVGTVPSDVQLGRPAVLPFDVSNVSGTDAEPTVTVDVPAGVRVTSLDAGVWTCTAEGVAMPVDGPVTLTCSADAPIAAGVTLDLDLPVVVTASGVTVTATAEGDLFDPVPANNTDAIALEPAPAAASGLTVTKDDGIPAMIPGQQTTYTVSVANQLVAEAIGPVEIVDTLPTGVGFLSATAGGVYDAGAGTVTWTIPALGAAAEIELVVTISVPSSTTATSVTNTVTARADDPAFPGVELTGTAADTNQIDRILLTKSAQMVAPGDPADPQPGDVLEYEFLIQNLGGGTLTDVAVTDAKPGLGAISFPGGWPATEGTLAAGESVIAVARYEITADDIDAGGTANTATAVGESAGGEQVASSSTVDFALPAVGGIVLTKSAQLDLTDAVQAGDSIEYTFEIQNTGNVTLHDVAVSDGLAGLSTITYEWEGPAGELGAGDSVTARATYGLSQEDIDAGSVANTATVVGFDPGNAELTATDSVLTAIPAVPAASLTKSGELLGDETRPVAGDDVEFTFILKNTGNVTLTAVDLEDHLDGVGPIAFAAWPDQAGELAPGESVTATALYPLAQADVDAGELTNTATLTGAGVRGGDIADDAEATVILPAAAGLVITKSAQLGDGNGDGIANAGESITYTFELENTGNVTLTDVVVADPEVTGIPVTSTLVPGGQVTVAADEYLVTLQDAVAGRVENTATATATAPDGETITADPSSVTVEAALLPDEGLAATGATIQAAILLGAAGILGLGAALLLSARRRRKAIAME